MSREICQKILDHFYDKKLDDEAVKLFAELEAELAKPEPEPVGWLYDFQTEEGMVKNWFTSSESEVEQSHALNIRNIYTLPPRREQLSDAELFAAAKEGGFGLGFACDFLRLYRAIEKRTGQVGMV